MFIQLPAISKGIMVLLVAGYMTLSSIAGLYNSNYIERNKIDPRWSKGHYNGYEIEGMVFNEPSKYGINNGRVSKLWVRKDGNIIIAYDRGWDIKPKSKDDRQLLKEITDRLEKLDKYKEE